jgi:hypothetical protein
MGAVIHFVSNHATPDQQALQHSPQRYVEILPVSGASQDQWMRAFLESVDLDQPTKDALTPLVAEPYSTATNATFTRALGVHGNKWRVFRTGKMVAHIEEWASAANIPMPTLSLPAQRPNVAVTEVAPSASRYLSKDKAIKLLDLLSEKDIEDVVIPILATTLLVKRQR